MSSQQRFNTHLQNITDVSSISTIDETFISTTDIVEDHDYGSVRTTVGAAASSEIDANDDNINLKPSNEEKEDVGLVLKLQHKLADTEKEKERLQKRLDLIELSPKYNKAQNEKHDAIRIAQLEVANSKLKSQLYELSEGVEDGNEKNQLTSQLQILQDELERRSEEIIQLKGVLASQTDKMQAIVNCRSKTGEYINEDGELTIAYETQKIINRQLELELQDEKSKYKAYEKEFKLETKKLREDNERQQRLLSANLFPTPKSQTEAFMDHEITRLTTENLDLRDRNDLLNETVRKLKKQINILSKKLKESGVDFEDTINEVTIKGDDTIEPNFKPRNRLPCIRRKEREYLGMFSYRKGEENAIIKKLVIDLKPKTADTLLPGLPAYILFMCIRHTDHVNDEDKVQTLLNAFISSVNKVIKKRPEDLETNVLWLSNTLRLVNIMKQYSGDKAFQTKSSAKQINQCLRNFDLTEYRGVIADTALLILQGILRNVEVKLQPMIVPAILEHEEISCVGGSGFKSRAHSSRDVESRDVKQNPVDTLLQELTGIYKMLKLYGVELDIISQIFKQVFYFICASSLNKLLLRKDLCHWAKGSHIKHNLSHFETWTREKQLEEQSIQATLQPIIQAAYLLQARKHDDDVASICEMCSALNSLQICKILNLYTPTDEYEERVPASFISKVQQKLEECPNNQEQQPLMDPSYKYTITFWFNPSEQRLEDIEIADVLKLPMLKKV